MSFSSISSLSSLGSGVALTGLLLLTPLLTLEAVDFMNPLLGVDVLLFTEGERGGNGCVSTRRERPLKVVFIITAGAI